MSENALALNKKLTEVSKQLQQSVLSVIGQAKMDGFEKAYTVSQAIGQLQALLTAEYMKPIMALQNNRLGFKTDKPQGGYGEDVVKNCLIEAVLTGVQPTGNQFNIISGNCYITKEGFGYMLGNMKGLVYEIIPGMPKSNTEKTGATIPMKINWNYNGNAQERTIEFAIKMNQYMGADAIIGKATRKARAWLYNNLNETEIGDGDIEDGKAEVLETVKPKTEADIAAGKIIDALDKYTGIDKADIVEECQAAQVNGEFTVEFAQTIAKKLGITL